LSAAAPTAYGAARMKMLCAAAAFATSPSTDLDAPSASISPQRRVQAPRLR